MRKIENIMDLKLEEYKLKLKAEKLSNTIQSQWNEMKHDIHPGKLAANLAIELAENKLDASAGWQKLIINVIRALLARQ